MVNRGRPPHPLRPETRSPRQRVLTIVAALAGTALFAYAVRRVGVPEIMEGVRRVGWGLLALVALAGLRFAVRAESWRLCMPAGTRLTLGEALRAFLAGDAIGSVTPLGLLASEPMKVFLTRHHLATRDSVASLAVENLAYAGSVVVMVTSGLVVLLTTAPVPGVWRSVVVGGLIALAASALAAPRMLRGSWISKLVPTFPAIDRTRLSRAFVLELSFHALAVFEVFLTLRWLLGDRSPSLAQAVVFETMNRVVVVAFKFVPFRIGVDEAVSAALAPLLAVDPAAAVALAVVRKIRNLFWAAVGLILIARHPAG